MSLSMDFLSKIRGLGEGGKRVEERESSFLHVPPHKLYVCRLVPVNLETDAAVVVKTT